MDTQSKILGFFITTFFVVVFGGQFILDVRGIVSESSLRPLFTMSAYTLVALATHRKFFVVEQNQNIVIITEFGSVAGREHCFWKGFWTYFALIPIVLYQ